MFTLIYNEQGVSRRQPLPPGETIVGRGATCGLIINDASVSRQHARFKVEGDVCTLTDLGSRNGTFRNGEPIKDTEVHDGDSLVVGRVPVQVEQSLAEKLALDEDHALFDMPGTVYRRIDQTTVPETGITGAGVDSGRALTLLSEIARTLVKTQPLADVLNRVVDLTFESIPADRAFLMLNDESTGTLVPRVVRARQGPPPERASISRTLVKMVMDDRVAMLAADAKIDPRLGSSESIQVQDIRSLMCAPLWNQSDVIGIIYVDNPRSKKFTAADLDLFTALSNYAAVAIEQARLSARVLEETRRRERLQRYHSPAVVDRILHGEEAEAPFIAQEREVSVLFSDLVGFTAMSEGMRPQQVALLLNTYFSRMADVIFEHEGTLDKFIGDAILAVFGAPLDQPDHARRAVRTAVAMRQALAKFNEEHPATPLQVRIAINSGPAMAGDIGSPKRREYTVLGDTVNLASRLESSVAKPGQIVIARNTYDQADGEFQTRSLGTFTLRGRQAPVEVFEVDG